MGGGKTCENMHSSERHAGLTSDGKHEGDAARMGDPMKSIPIGSRLSDQT